MKNKSFILNYLSNGVIYQYLLQSFLMYLKVSVVENIFHKHIILKMFYWVENFFFSPYQ